MNFVILFPSELEGRDICVLQGTRSQEVANRHLLHEGKNLGVVLLGSQWGGAKVILLTSQEIVLEFSALKPPPEKAIQVAIVGVSRPQTIKKVIQSAVTMGVKELHFVKSELGEKSYLQSKSLLPEEIRDEIFKGIEQCGDPVPPIVEVHPSFENFCGETLTRLSERYPGSQRIVGHTRAGEVLGKSVSISHNQPVFMAVGCELGWSEGEIKRLLSLGFNAISLGERILRVETAFTALIAQTQLARLL